MPDNFAVLILSHGRPDNVLTYDSLRSAGFSGRVVIVVDDLDPTVPEYRKRYGDEVFVFDKQATADETDLGDNFGGLSTVLIARNACYKIAEEIGVQYFMVLDDDYSEFHYRYGADNKYWARRIFQLDTVIGSMLEFVKTAPVSCLCMLQGGDYIGGAENRYSKSITLIRKAMNSFLCNTERPVEFLGRMNDDVNTYVVRGNTGALMMSTTQVSLNQALTQTSTGGLTGMYLELGTYVKSFYTVMMQPSSVKISTMGRYDMRIHHSIRWKNTVPMILSEDVRKPRPAA